MRISIKAARVNRGLTQKEAAEALKVNKKTLSYWETGKIVPRLDRIPAICELYGVLYDDIEWNAKFF